jgi:putative autoinducer-2 (AI-2) aldolase
MEWGMANRLSRTIKPDGRCFYLAVDHGYFQGPTHCLENPGRTAEPLLKYVDAVFMPRGSVRFSLNPQMETPLILRVSGGNSMIGDDLSNEEVSVSTREIIRLNAAAVGISVYVGSKYEHQTIMALSKLVDECSDYGIPVMAVTAVGREEEKKSARYLALASRVCAEQGAAVVKTYYCEDFEKVVEGCPVPVVIAGGPRTENDLEVIEFVYDGMQRGAIGVNLGRNIWQNESPEGMARALQMVIHEKATPQEAFEVFEEMRRTKKAL